MPHQQLNLLRQSLKRRKTDDAMAVAHAAKAAMKAEAKVADAAAVGVVAAIVQSAAKAVVNAPNALKVAQKDVLRAATQSAAKPARVSAKSAMANARTTAPIAVVSAQSAVSVVKAEARARSETVAAVPVRMANKTAANPKLPLALTTAPKPKPRCVPRLAPSAWPAKSAQANHKRAAMQRATKAAANAAHVAKIAGVSVLLGWTNKPMHKAHCR